MPKTLPNQDRSLQCSPPKADPSSLCRPPTGSDRRRSVTKESGLSAAVSFGSKSAKKGAPQWGHCQRQTEWSRRSSRRTEFAINECLHCGRITGEEGRRPFSTFQPTENGRKDSVESGVVQQVIAKTFHKCVDKRGSMRSTTL